MYLFTVKFLIFIYSLGKRKDRVLNSDSCLIAISMYSNALLDYMYFVATE